MIIPAYIFLGILLFLIGVLFRKQLYKMLVNLPEIIIGICSATLLLLYVSMYLGMVCLIFAGFYLIIKLTFSLIFLII
jgi:hypothetical protein